MIKYKLYWLITQFEYLLNLVCFEKKNIFNCWSCLYIFPLWNNNMIQFAYILDEKKFFNYRNWKILQVFLSNNIFDNMFLEKVINLLF
jgi:hypothetical protein